MMRHAEFVSDPLLVDGKTPGGLRRWEAPDGAASVILNSTLMEELRTRAIQAYLSVPKRGAEIGGLLFGSVGKNGSVTFQIDGCEEIPCEHRFGPSYKLSDTDFDSLRERMAQQQHDGSEPVIGLYRSYTGRDAALDDTDLDLVRNMFPHPRLVSLLLQPISAEKCMARFQFGSGGELAADQLYEPFLFEPAQLKAEVPAQPEPPQAEARPTARLRVPPMETHRPAPVPPTPFVAQEASSPAPVPAAPDVAPDRRRQESEAPRASRGSRIWLPLLLCALAAVAGAAAFGFWTLERQPRWTPMGLDAAASPRELLLSWDPTVPVIEQASRGVMTVTDGSVQNNIPLTAAQLRGGKLPYLASSPNVLFRLLVYDADNRASGDSLRVANLHTVDKVQIDRTQRPKPVTAQPPTAPPDATPATVAAQAQSTTPPDDAAPVAIPAVARREVQPDVPAGIRARILARTVIPVQVHIDASGRVTQAAAKATGSGVERYLADQAAQAARRWSFVPAHSRSKQAIPSIKTVEFVFVPEQSQP